MISAKEENDTKVLEEAKYALAWALIQSQDKRSIEEGILLLEGKVSVVNVELQLMSNTYNQEEIHYVLALGYYNNNNPKKCLSLLSSLIKDGPGNEQFLDLKAKAEDKITRGILHIYAHMNS